MKKLLIIGIAALAALAMVTCDNAPANVSSAGGGITLSVGGAGARALTGEIAEGGSDFFEASFRVGGATGTAIIRTTWDYARTGKIELNPGIYDVIIFAGRDEDRMLLGVGTASGIDGEGTGAENGTVGGGAGLEIEITPATREITFTLEPLMNAIDDTATSTFKIVDGPIAAAPGVGASRADSFGNLVPVFMVNTVYDTANPTADPPIAVGDPMPTNATWSFTIGNGTSLATLYEDEIFLAAAPRTFNIGVSSQSSKETPVKLDSLEFVDPPSVGEPLSECDATGTFNLEIQAPDADGVCKIAVEIPVHAMGKLTAGEPVGFPVTWYIKGGSYNSLLDAGPSPSSDQPAGRLGGSIVLGFGLLANLPKISLIPEEKFDF